MSDQRSLRPLPAAFVATRASLQLVAVRILAVARFQATGHLGLEPVPGGFGIPEPDGPNLAVVDGELSDGTRSERLTTLMAAAAFAGIDPTSESHPALEVAADLEAPLDVDIDSAKILGDWYGFCQETLQAFAATAEVDDDPSSIQLWPEHFDLAMELGALGYRANFGGSPGDGDGEPYLYVGPHDHRDGMFWNAPFGATLSYEDLLDGNDPLAFFQHGKRLLAPE